MLKRVLIVACLMMTAGAFPSPGPGRAPYILPPAASFVTLADSSWGTGASRAADDLTDRIPTFQPLPFQGDTTGYTTDTTYSATTSCTTNTTVSSVQSTINSICSVDTVEDTILVLPNCDMVKEDDNAANFLSIPQDCDGLHLQGQANTKFTLATTSGFPTQADGEWNRSFIEVSGNADSPTVLATCGWTAGFAMGSTQLTTNCDLATSGAGSWPVGSVVQVLINDFNGGDDTTANTFRIAAVDTSPSSADVITLDMPLTMDYTPSGGDPYTFDITGHTINLVERIGSGVSDGASTTCSAAYNGDSDCLAERVSFADITFSTAAEARYIHGGTYGDVRSQRAFELAFDNIKMERGTAAKFSLGRKNGRVFIKDSWLVGPSWQAVCYGPITSITNANPAVVTIDNTSGNCGASSPSNNPGLYLSSAVGGEAGLADNIHKITNMANSGTDMLITLDLDRSAQSALGSGGYASVQDAFGVAAFYADGTNVHMVNSIMENIRVGFLMQNDEAAGIGQGTHGHALVYNYFPTETTEHCGRDVFFHGNPESSGFLFEGNVGNCSWTLAANSPGSGSDPQAEGVNATFFRNYLFDNGTGTAFNGLSNFGDTCGDRGYFCTIERGNVDADASSQFWIFIANAVEGLIPSSSGFDYHNNPLFTGGFIDMYLGKNLWVAENIDDDFSTTNTTTDRPDGVDVGGGLNTYGLSADIDEASTFPSGWSSWSFPSSIYYDASASRADWSNGHPPWGCTESGSFPYAGVDRMDGSPPDIPAKIRFEAGTCTAP